MGVLQYSTTPPRAAPSEGWGAAKRLRRILGGAGGGLACESAHLLRTLGALCAYFAHPSCALLARRTLGAPWRGRGGARCARCARQMAPWRSQMEAAERCGTAVRHGPPLRGPPPPPRGHWIRLCQVRLRHAASVLGIIDGCVVACCRTFLIRPRLRGRHARGSMVCGLHAAGFFLLQTRLRGRHARGSAFWIPRRSRLLPEPRVCLRP